MNIPVNQDELLDKIRALLAKAEATHFSAEAKAFSAKAQELMTKYALNEAMLDAKQGHVKEVVQKEIYVLANLYFGPKSALLNEVVEANNCHCVFGPWTSERRVGGELRNCHCATLVGYQTDCDFAERLFTSLMLQAQTAFYATTTQDRMQSDCPTSGQRVSWRNAFMRAYAFEIGRRLTKAKQKVQSEAQAQYTAQSMALVLASKEALVERRFAELFPDTEKGRPSKAGLSAWNTAAAALGKAAAQRADLGGPKLSGNQKQLRQ